MVTAARIHEFEKLRHTIVSWAEREPAIIAVAIVGSWARGEPRMDSDADVVVLTEDPRFVADESWIVDLFDGDAGLVRTVDWGALTERRVRLSSGVEIEFGFARPSWADVEPLDPGTREVVSDGCEAWYDPAGLVATLVTRVEDGSPPSS